MNFIFKFYQNLLGIWLQYHTTPHTKQVLMSLFMFWFATVSFQCLSRYLLLHAVLRALGQGLMYNSVFPFKYLPIPLSRYNFLLCYLQCGHLYSLKQELHINPPLACLTLLVFLLRFHWFHCGTHLYCADRHDRENCDSTNWWSFPLWHVWI